MCGIAGYINFKERKPDKDRVSRMLELMHHRGPDERGVFGEGAVAIGTARLAIIDLAGGQQPISNETGRVWASLNGEIYNFQDLRVELEEKGHVFKTKSDTEVVVHSYEEWGEEFVNKIKGMFGLAVLDLDNQKLFLARDGMGEKPIFFVVNDDFLAFASEMRPLLELPITKTINSLAVQSFFAFSRPVGALCIYNEIKKLLPGQLLKINLVSKDYSIENYWRPLSQIRELNEADAETQLLATLEETMKKHLIAEVPIGAFLSGGTDSSAMVALMRRFFNQPVKTFTAVYEDKKISEASEARRVAEILGTDHYEVMIKPEDVAAVLPELIRHLEEPFGDASFVPTYFVSKKAREQVTVAITGDGGDELFGGYFWYYVWQWLERYRKLPKILKIIIEYLLMNKKIAIVARWFGIDYYWQGGRKIVLASQESDNLRAFLKLTARADLEKLVSREVIEQLYEERKRFFGDEGGLGVRQIMSFQSRSLLPELFFTKVDRMSMANSLECRSPLVYRDVVELAMSLPTKFLIRGRKQKYLLKKVFSRWLPAEILYRPKKGFSIPFYKWLREDVELRAMVEESVFGAENRVRLAGFGINADYLAEETKRYLKGENNNWTLPWRAVCFNLWGREFGLWKK